MKQKYTKTNNKSLHTALVFCILVICILIIGSIIRFIILFSQMQFDRKHRFTLLAVKNVNYAQVLSFAPDKNTISIIDVHTNGENNNVGKELAVPFDATVTDPALTSQEAAPSILGRLVGHYNDEHPSGLNILDAIFLLLFSRGVHTNQIQTTDISLPYTGTGNDIAGFFVDNTIYTESMTIAVVNASDISGRGNKLARLLTNMGGNIISVTTADNPQQKSTIAFDMKNSYTVKKLIPLLHVQVTPLPQNSLSDIIITIGEDEGYSPIY